MLPPPLPGSTCPINPAEPYLDWVVGAAIFGLDGLPTYYFTTV
jgi:hypothetical protein